MQRRRDNLTLCSACATELANRRLCQPHQPPRRERRMLGRHPHSLSSSVRTRAPRLRALHSSGGTCDLRVKHVTIALVRSSVHSLWDWRSLMDRLPAAPLSRPARRCGPSRARLTVIVERSAPSLGETATAVDHETLAGDETGCLRGEEAHCL